MIVRAGMGFASVASVIATALVFAGGASVGIAGCGGSDGASVPADDGGGTTVPPGSSGGDSGPGSSSDAAVGTDGSSGDAGPVGAVDDPAKDGPFAIAESDVTVSAETTGTGDALTLHVAAPTGAGPFPVVFLAPGYLLATSQYLGYVKRLASHGIVGVTVGFPQDSSKQAKDAKDLQAALDWAGAPGGSLAGVIDAKHAGVMGHSRGGKAAVLAGLYDKRFAAVLALDPVDSKPPFSICDTTTECPDASEAIAALTVPSGFLGETLDGTGTFQACAPTADNFQTFYAKAPSPSFAVTIQGASHMSFVGDLASCGFTCSVCKTATRAQAEVTSLAYAYTAAFFRRHLRGETAYDTYLTGAEAKARYVSTGVATIETK